MPARYATEADFWVAVDKGSDEQECWPWTGPVNGRGYGSLYFRIDGIGRVLGAHVVANYLATGEVSSRANGLVVMHSCDNPPCCNPAHLSMGSLADNWRDCNAKGRWRSGSRLRGEAVAISKLNPDKVREIRRRRAAGETWSSLSAAFGVRIYALEQVVSRKTWAHVP